MKTELYWVSVALMVSASAISLEADLHPALYRPLNPGPFVFITRLATIGWFIAIIAGFFLFRWYDPFIGFGIGVAAAFPLRTIALSSDMLPSITMLIAIAGIFCGIILFFT